MEGRREQGEEGRRDGRKDLSGGRAVPGGMWGTVAERGLLQHLLQVAR